jgi:Nif-specific regulatory protein
MSLPAAELISRSPSASQLLCGLLQLNPLPDPEWWPLALREVARSLGLPYVGLVQGAKGRWNTKFQSSRLPEDLPAEWLAELLDQEPGGSAPAGLGTRPATGGSVWTAIPLRQSQHPSELLVAHGPVSVQATLPAVVAAFELANAARNSAATAERRAARLRALLDVTIAWNRHRSTPELLHRIAETSTQLLDAERATIFLIDRTRGVLVGKPALGVAAGELLVPLQAGVVGRTVATGEVHRVDSDIASEQALVDRAVDQSLNYRTRSLICAPMKDARGQVIGAFELINKRQGNFTSADEAELVELAAHASVAIDNAQRVEQLVESNRQVAEQAAGRVQMIGQSPAIEKVKVTAARVAHTDLNLLITGENGTGKEVIAQMVHYMSPRRDQILVAVNCAAISETLLESELFGHEKGAFTDAYQARKGKFELATGGTLFLDEIGDLSLGGQAKLLRVLEDKVVVRVGGSTPIPTNARVVAATNQDLAQLVREKKFREDLFFRLNVVSIQMPPLRDRGDDILLLSDHFLKWFATKARRPTPELAPAARKRLLTHDWPGNVRELRNMMERIAYLSHEQRIEADDLPFLSPTRAVAPLAAVTDRLPLADATDQFQRDYIESHIRRAHGNMTEAAESLGLHRSNLYRKMNQLGMDGDKPPRS